MSGPHFGETEPYTVEDDIRIREFILTEFKARHDPNDEWTQRVVADSEAEIERLRNRQPRRRTPPGRS